MPTYQPGNYLAITIVTVLDEESHGISTEDLETTHKSADLTQEIRDLILRYNSKLAKEEFGSEEYKTSSAIIKELGSVLGRHADNKSRSQNSLLQSLTEDLLGVLGRYSPHNVHRAHNALLTYQTSSNFSDSTSDDRMVHAEREIKRLEQLNKSTLELHENEIRSLNSKIDELNVRIEKMVTLESYQILPLKAAPVASKGYYTQSSDKDYISQVIAKAIYFTDPTRIKAVQPSMTILVLV
jgi:hypothetical protein